LNITSRSYNFDIVLYFRNNSISNSMQPCYYIGENVQYITNMARHCELVSRRFFSIKHKKRCYLLNGK